MLLVAQKGTASMPISTPPASTLTAAVDPSTRSPVARRTITVLLIAGTAVLLFAVLEPHLELDALKAAGLMKAVPAGGGVWQQMLSSLQSDAEWFIGTGIGLMVVLVSGMLVFGSQRAPDHFFRIGAGVAGILILLPAVMA
jgi:hypothetical protein